MVCTFGGCRQKTATPVEIHRFDKVMFTTPPASLTEKLASVRNEYNTELLNIQPDNPDRLLALQQPQGQIRPDKPGRAGDEKGIHQIKSL